MDGVEVTSATHPQVATSKIDAESDEDEVTYTITLSDIGEAQRVSGVPFKNWSGIVTIKIAGRGQAESTYGVNVLVDAEGNRSMMETDQSGTWVNVIYKDDSDVEGIDKNTNGQMFTDFVKPEFTYEYSNTTIGSGPTGNKKVTVVFDVLDQYYKQSIINGSDIQIVMPDYTAEEIQAAIDAGKITKSVQLKTIPNDVTSGDVTYKQNGDIYYEINGINKRIGQRYELVIDKLEQLYSPDNLGDGDHFSGTMSLVIPAGQKTTGAGGEEVLVKGIIDNSGNLNDAITISIGIDETDGDTTTNDGGVAEIVDVVDPVWQAVNSAAEPGQISMRASDKYFDRVELDETNIKVISNGVVSEDIGIDLSDPTYVKQQADGTWVVTNDPTEADGVEYSIQLSNVTVENPGPMQFDPVDENGNPITVVGGKPQYLTENGGAVKVRVDAGTAFDKSGNINKETTFDMGFMDDTRPQIYDIQKTQNENDKTITMVFNATDKNFDGSDPITPEELDIWLDGKLLGDTNGNNELDEGETCPIHKDLTSVALYEKIAANNTTNMVGFQYTLVLSEIVETQAQLVASGRDFRELSGTLEVRIKQNAAKDLNSNTLNPEKLVLSDFVDFIRPEITYKYTTSSQAVAGDIDYEGKTFTMVFDITDKYFKESTLTINDLTILIDNEAPDWREAGETVGVTRTLTPTDLKATFNKTVDEDVNNNSILDDGEDKNGNGTLDHSVIVNEEHVIGKRYTLVLSNLEQLEKLAGKQYLDYSGVITVAIGNEETNGKVTDTSDNKNDGKTITSGIDIKADVPDAGDPSVTVDVVDPIWEKLSTSANASNQTATIEIRGTDKYYASVDLTNKIKVYAHTGSTPGATGLSEITSSVTISGANAPSPVYKTGTEDQIGSDFTLTITGFEKDVNQIKIEILADAMLDESGNGNQPKEFILYNTLRLTSSETAGDSAFLGEETIKREYIHKVVFESSI